MNVDQPVGYLCYLTFPVEPCPPFHQVAQGSVARIPAWRFQICVGKAFTVNSIHSQQKHKARSIHVPCFRRPRFSLVFFPLTSAGLLSSSIPEQHLQRCSLHGTSAGGKSHQLQPAMSDMPRNQGKGAVRLAIA